MKRQDIRSSARQAMPEQIVHDEKIDAARIEDLIMEGINSGEPFEVGPDYWEEKHRRLEKE